MDLVGPLIEIVKFIGGPIVRYLKYQIYFNNHLEQFKVSKEDLCSRKRDIELRLDTELQSGKTVKEDVQRWLKDVEELTTRQDVEEEVNNLGCLSCCCRVKILEERTRKLKQIYDKGDRYTNECLVIEDQSRKLNAFAKNFNELREKIQCKQGDVGSTLLSQLRYGKIAKVEVKCWLAKVEEITGPVAKDIEGKINKARSLSHIASAPLVKLLKEKIPEMERIFEEGRHLPESLVIDDPLASRIELPTSKLQGSEDVKAEILACLIGDEVTKLGVWGMGGVGKTTIMMHVHNEMLREAKFKKVIWVTVSQIYDTYDMQEQITCSLKEELDEKNTTIRAGILSKMLKGHMPYLLILDDVWRSFELKDVGIPESLVSDGCKLVLTTRSQEVARSMGCKRITVKTLSQRESLKLFLHKVGDTVLSDHGGIKGTLESTLKGIVDECGGLPLAIVTVASSLKEVSDPRLWNTALNQLRQRQRIVAGTDDGDAFRILKFSYDHLKNSKIQNCFLCCALFPEDYNIPKEVIIEYWIDEGFIDETEARQAMKDEGHYILRKLEDNCLLESIIDQDGKDCVRMHDLLRDMALYVTRTSPRFLVKAGLALKNLPDPEKWTKNLEKISLMRNQIEEIPSNISSSTFTMLITFLLSHNNLSTIPESLFEHMPELKILDLSFNYCLSSLPNSISKLVSLNTLLLHLTSLTEVPSLSNLRALKKLDLGGTKIKEIPKGLEMLTNLKYLDLSGVCRDGIYESPRLHEIPDGVLSNLSRLHHLFVDEKRIALKGEGIARLVKLEAFRGRFISVHDMTTFLKCLQHQGDGLSKYFLTIGRRQSFVQYKYMMAEKDGEKFMAFVGIDIVGEIMLLPCVRQVSIEGCNNVRSLNDISAIKDATDLRECSIEYCEGMKCVFSSSVEPFVQTLEYLNLDHLDNLDALFEAEAMHKSPQLPSTFPCLKLISIGHCGKIKKLFSPWMLLGYLQSLEKVVVYNCEQMEEIIASDPEEGQKQGVFKLIFPKLKYLRLENLSALKSICSTRAVIVCDSLEEIEIKKCEGLTRIPLSLLQLVNGQLSPPPSLKTIGIQQEWWELLEWGNPNAKDVLLPFCRFL